MTKHDLKKLAAIGAELGAAKAENEKLRGLLTKALEFTEANTCGGPDVAQLIAEMRVALYRQADHVRDAAQMMVPSEIIKAIAWGDRDDAAEAIGNLRCLLADPDGEDEVAFPDSPEPTDTYTAVDMATAAAQGFRDGQAAVEPAPAQDEKAAFEAAYHVVVDNGWTNVKHMARQVWDQARATRPAQAEQQPVCWASSTALAKLRNGRNNSPCVLTDGPAEFNDTPLYAIAQTAPQPEQSGYLPLSLTELLQRYKRDLEIRTFPDNDEGDYQLRWTAKEIARVNAALSVQGAGDASA